MGEVTIEGIASALALILLIVTSVRLSQVGAFDIIVCKRKVFKTYNYVDISYFEQSQRIIGLKECTNTRYLFCG